MLSIEQQMWQKWHSSKPLALPLRGGPSNAADNTPLSIAAAAAALRAEPGSAAAAAAAAGANDEAAAGMDAAYTWDPAQHSAGLTDELHLSPSLLPVAAVEVTGSSGSDSLCAAKQSIQINVGLMSLPALSFPGSGSGGGVPVSKASKAAGLRTS